MGPFKERFGLDYLKEQDAEGDKSESVAQKVKKGGLPPGMEDALLAYGRPVLDALNTSAGKTSQLFDIAKQIDVRIDILIPVVEYLASKGHLERVQVDKLGNDTLRLTQSGEKLLR